MDTNRMKLGLVYIFSENKNIPKKAKLQLINFIEQADTHQLKVLAMDGEIVPKGMFDKQTEEVVNDRFATMPHIEEALNKASFKAIETIEEGIFKANPEKIKDRIRLMNHMLSSLRVRRSNCNQMKSSDQVKKCVKTVDKAVQKVKKQIAKLQNKM